MVVLWDLVFAYGSDECYLMANDAAANELGLSTTDFVGSHWTDLGLSTDVMQPFMDELSHVLTSREPKMLTVVGSPERGSRIFHTSLTPLLSEGGEPFGVLVIARDVTDFVRGPAY